MKKIILPPYYHYRVLSKYHLTSEIRAKQIIRWFMACLILSLFFVLALRAENEVNKDKVIEVSQLNGEWRMDWREDNWNDGSAFELEDGKVKGTPFTIHLDNTDGRLTLHDPKEEINIRFNRLDENTWTGQTKNRTLTMRRITAPATLPQLNDLNGTWKYKVYGEKSFSSLTLSDGLVTGLQNDAISTRLDGRSLFVPQNDGGYVRFYFDGVKRWVGFGYFPKNQGTIFAYRPVVLVRD